MSVWVRSMGASYDNYWGKEPVSINITILEVKTTNISSPFQFRIIYYINNKSSILFSSSYFQSVECFRTMIKWQDVVPTLTLHMTPTM